MYKYKNIILLLICNVTVPDLDLNCEQFFQQYS